MKKKHVKTFLIWLALVNWPPILIWIPLLKLAMFMPFLFWVNIPGLWFGLARLIGPPHFAVGEFGAMPQTPPAWILIAAFWVLVAAGLTILTSSLLGSPNRKTPPASHGEGAGS